MGRTPTRVLEALYCSLRIQHHVGVRPTKKSGTVIRSASKSFLRFDLCFLAARLARSMGLTPVRF